MSIPHGTWVEPVAVSITTEAKVIAAANANRKALLIYNVGSVDVFFGLGGVTAATGIPLKVGGSLGLGPAFITDQAIYGITATGTADLRVLEVI